jgi:hypothetical protein
MAVTDRDDVLVARIVLGVVSPSSSVNNRCLRERSSGAASMTNSALRTSVSWLIADSRRRASSASSA